MGLGNGVEVFKGFGPRVAVHRDSGGFRECDTGGGTDISISSFHAAKLVLC